MEFIYQINEQTQLKLFQESDTRKIIEFINKFKVNDKISLSKSTYVNDQLLNDSEYSEINIRANLYEYYEEFIGVINENDIKLLVAISVNKNNRSRSLNLNLICGEKKYLTYLKELFIFAENILSEYAIIQPTKIITYLISDNKYTTDWQEILLNAGFEVQAIRENEKGVGKSLTTLIKNFERRHD